MKKVALFLTLFTIWLIFTFNLQLASIVAGIIASFTATVIFSGHSLSFSGKLLQPARYFWAVLYLIIFIWECIKANFDVAYRVLHPALPIHPGIVKVRLGIQSDIGRTILANSITMTPGTITVDIIGDYIYIHWINITSNDASVYSDRICGKFEKYIRRIFE